MSLYKNNGKWYTASLFIEIRNTNAEYERTHDPIFSLNGREGYIDARSTFVELMDPTGYKWAIKYLHSWEHFTVLLEAPWFAKEFNKWVDEVKTIIRQKALEKIDTISGGETNQALAAAKYLANAEWEGSRVSKRGRPSTTEVTGELKRLANEAAGDQEDARRIGLSVIKGGKA